MLKSAHVAMLLAAGLALATTLPAQAVTTVFATTMTGAAEFVPNLSPAVGHATVTFDSVTKTVGVSEDWAGLLGLATGNHIHVASVPGGAGGIVLGFSTFVNPSPKSGTYGATFTLGEAAFTSLLNSTSAGLSYVNLHTQSVPGGEIRGFLVPVPEPTTYALMLGGLGLLGLSARRRQRG